MLPLRSRAAQALVCCFALSALAIVYTQLSVSLLMGAMLLSLWAARAAWRLRWRGLPSRRSNTASPNE